MDNLREFGLELKIEGQEQAAQAQAKLDALDAAGKKAAVSASALEAQTYDLADADEVAAKAAAREAEIRARVAEAARLAAKDLYELATTEATEAQTAKKAADAAVEQATAQDKAGASAKSAGQKIRQATNDTRDARQGFVDISRAAQDFSQGGFAAIVNNLEGIGRGLGAMLSNPLALLSSFPALLTLAGVGLLTFGEQLKKVGESIADQWNPERLKGIRSEIDKLNDTIKELKDKSVKLAVDTLELENAERRLKELTKLQNDWEARQKQQSPEEAEAGKATKERLEMEEGGIAGVQDALKTKFAKEFTEASPVLKFVDEELAAAAQGYARDQLTGIRVFVGKALAENYVKLLKEQGAQERQRIGQSAWEQATRVLNAPIEGRGAGMVAGRKTLAEQLKGLGMDVLASDVEGTTPEAIKAADQDIREEEAQAQRLKAAGEKRRAAAAKAKKAEGEARKTFADAIKDELEVISASGVLDKELERIKAEAERAKLKGQALFQFVANQTEDFLQRQLAARGINAPAGLGPEGRAAAAEPIGDLAARTARAARIAQERGEAAGEKKDAAAEAKAEDKARADERRRFKTQGIADRAAAVYSRARAQGATPDQAFDVTTQQALAFLNRDVTDRFGRRRPANPGMSDEQKNLLATRIASQGRAGFQGEIANAAARGVTGVEATQQAMEATQAAVAALAARQERVEAKARRLQQNGARLARRADEHQPTALNNGGPN